MQLPSEKPYFIVPDATLQQLKCHTPLSETYGIPDDEVWHFGELGVALEAPECGIRESHLFIFTSYKSPLRSFRLRTLP
mgnify:CR=1 FL=1